MLRVRNAFLTTLSTGSAFVIQFLVSIAIVPLLLQYLGVGGYGLVVTITGMVSWLSVLDGGIGLSLKNELIREQPASGLNKTVTELVSTSFFSTFFIILLAAVIATSAAGFLRWDIILNLNGQTVDHTDVVNLIFVAIWLVLLSIPFNLSRSVYSSQQKEFLFTPWLVLGSVSKLLLTWVAITLNLGFVWVGSVALASNLIPGFLGMIWLQIRTKNYQISLTGLKKRLVGRLMKPGIAFFTIQICSILIFQSGTFITNLFLGQESAAEYSVHSQLFMYLQLVVSLIINPFWPALGEARHNGEKAWYSRTVVWLTVIAAGVSILYGLVVNLWGVNIFVLWTHNKIAWNPSLGLVLTVYSIMISVIGVPAMVLGSMGVVRDPAKVIVLQALLNVSLTILFVKTIGIVGVALGSLLSYVITSGWYVPVKLRKSLAKWQVV